MKNNTLWAGVDYSMNSPAISVRLPDGSVHLRCFGKQKQTITVPGFEIAVATYPEWETAQHRYDLVSEWILGALTLDHAVGIEDYAFSRGATGRGFHIGEMTEVFKWKWWSRTGRCVEVVKPNTVKKFATGNGAAKKELMAEAFHGATGLWAHELLGCKNSGASPASDVVDAYWIMRWFEERTDE